MPPRRAYAQVCSLCHSLAWSAQAFETWRQELQRALAVAFAQTQHTFAARGVEAGTTATVVLQAGWLVTCANVGDSLAFIDHGNEVITLHPCRTRKNPTRLSPLPHTP